LLTAAHQCYHPDDDGKKKESGCGGARTKRRQSHSEKSDSGTALENGAQCGHGAMGEEGQVSKKRELNTEAASCLDALKRLPADQQSLILHRMQIEQLGQSVATIEDLNAQGVSAEELAALAVPTDPKSLTDMLCSALKGRIQADTALMKFVESNRNALITREKGIALKSLLRDVREAERLTKNIVTVWRPEKEK
jgi:hypothetical protein